MIKPRLSRFDLTMIVVSLVIGMGIFATPAQVAVKAGNVWVFFGAWIFGGIVTLCGALTFAEIGARYPATGGFYKVFSYCYHPAFAFMINWVIILSSTASVAAVALIGADYIRPFLLPPGLQNDTGTKIITITSVLLIYGVNFLGIKTSARAQNLLIIFKMGMIFLICTAVFKNDPTPVLVAPVMPGSNLITAFGLSLVPVFFTYNGYYQTINFGGDIINAKKNIPKAIIAGIIIVIGLYLLINLAYYHVLGMAGLQHTPALAAKMVGLIFGPVGYKLISVIMFCSVMSFLNVSVMVNPRIYYAMAEDGILPQIFKKVNPKTEVQEFAMSFFVAAVIAILFFVAKFSEILRYLMSFNTIGLSLAAVTIFVLRKKTRHLEETGIYTVKWFPLTPIIFIASNLFVTINIFITFNDSSYAWLICLGGYLLGLVIYYIFAKKKKSVAPAT